MGCTNTFSLRGPTDSQSKSPLTQLLRKSCHFCRSRKIRCSGESICSACRERSIECSYRVCGPKGRPKRNTLSNAVPPLIPENSQQCSESAPSLSPLAIHSNANPSSHSGSAPFKNQMAEKDKISSASDFSVASRLQYMMDRLLNHQPNESSHPSGPILDALRNHLPMMEHQNINNNNTSKTAISYEELFCILGQECIEMLALRFGELGCHQLHQGRSRHILTSLSQDNTTLMLDSPMDSGDAILGYTSESNANQNNPLREYNNHMTIQMLEIWFSQHPFAFMFSKTLLLRDIRHETHSELLLAAMLADVQYGQETLEGNASGNTLTRWATASLHEVKQEDISLTTIEAVTLLGWRALCSSQPRRAICYFVWANCAIQTIPKPILGLSTINGIDVGEIESECYCNAHWLILSINLWIMMQVGVSGSLFPPDSAPTTFPSAEESSSATFTLDRKSYNLSTLQNQERMARELWLLSHVTATVSNIFALYSNSQPVEHPDEAAFSCWQSHLLRQLRHLASPVPDIFMLCRSIRKVLLGSVKLVETHAQQSRIEALALSASYTMMIIHFLVPSPLSSSEISGGMHRILAAGGISELVSNFCYSASALLKMLAMLNDGDGHAGRVVMSQRRHSSTTGIFVLALDACGRGLNFLYTLGQAGSEIEQKYIFEQKGELARLSTDLLSFGSLSILSSPGMEAVKRQLELAVCQFSESQFDFGACSSGSGSMRNESVGIGGSHLTSSLRAGSNEEGLVPFSGEVVDMDACAIDAMTSKHSTGGFGYDFPFIGNGFNDGGLLNIIDDHSVERAMQILSA